jgi:hypothetical protein
LQLWRRNADLGRQSTSSSFGQDHGPTLTPPRVPVGTSFHYASTRPKLLEMLDGHTTLKHSARFNRASA